MNEIQKKKKKKKNPHSQKHYSFITGLFSLAFGLCSLGLCSSVFLQVKLTVN
ncbi:hypothetical protein Hanom_Chr07g00625511 [Helianthus anomalus]